MPVQPKVHLRSAVLRTILVVATLAGGTNALWRTSPVLAQAGSDDRVAAIEHRVSSLETRMRGFEGEAAAGGLVLLLFGAFCALWAQNTRRNAWLWFFIGVVFSGIAVLVLLYKNSRDYGTDESAASERDKTRY